MSQARRARLCTAGKITQRNTDARFYTRLEDGTSPKKNFFVYYEIDVDQEVMTVLRTPNGTTATTTARGSCWSLFRVPAPQLA